MPFALIFIGLLLVITGAKGTQSALASELREDFTGDRNFTYWIIALGSIGALGYVESFRSFSRWFMALILIAMIIRNDGFFDKLMQAFATGPTPPPETAQARALPNADSTSSGNPVNDAKLGDLLRGDLGTFSPRILPGTIASDVATSLGNLVNTGRKLLGR